MLPVCSRMAFGQKAAEHMVETSAVHRRMEIVCQTIDRQKAYLARVPDPDNREAAEANLITLVAMRRDLEREIISAPQVG